MDGTPGAQENGRESGPVAAYKAILRDVLDRRPAGTRQRLANALGTNRSFISQIANPAYPVPIPAQHIPVLFEICHLSPAERTAFLDAYARAHPGRLDGASPGRRTRVLTLTVPDLGDAAGNAAFDAQLADVAARLARFAEELAGRQPQKGEEEEP